MKYRYNVAVSGLALEVPYGTLEEIRQLPGVKSAFVAPQYDLPEDMTDPAAEPNMYATKDTVGSAMTWENLGYTGQGMRIAIIDTGLDLDHPSFAVAPQLTEDSLTQEEIASVLESLNAYDLYLSKSAVKLTADVLYRSEKVPYGFNYVDRSLDVTHDNDYAGDHGTHVAGYRRCQRHRGYRCGWRGPGRPDPGYESLRRERRRLLRRYHGRLRGLLPAECGRREHVPGLSRRFHR